MATASYECGGCGHEAQGYSKSDLEKEGWVWHVVKKTAFGASDTHFILCDGCTGAAERRVQDRLEREQRARVPRANCSHCGTETLILPAPGSVVGSPYNKALPVSLCRRCDCYPETLRRVDYSAADWAMPDFFFPSAS